MTSTNDRALLTKAETEWLAGKKKVSKSYAYYLKSTIKKKVRILAKIELPLLINAGFEPLISGNLGKVEVVGPNPTQGLFTYGASKMRRANIYTTAQKCTGNIDFMSI